MTEEELNVIVEAKLAERLAARLAAEREQMRVEVILALRREASRAHYDRINARHPIETALAGLTVEQEAERRRLMAERTRAAGEHMDRVNARPVPGARASLRPTRADAAGGGVGFKIR
jgi:hypothetical protein